MSEHALELHAGQRKRKEPLDGSEGRPQQGSNKRQKICARSILESLCHYRIHPKEIEASNTIAQGATADVELAQLHSSDTLLIADGLSTEPEHIAVKKMRLDDDRDDEKVLLPFANELSLLSKLSHENIVKLRGFAEDTAMSIAWIIFRWEPNGNVREFLHSTDLVIPERISLIYDVICGIQYLHSREPPISHGDLKSLNILVNSQNRGLITDFGSARVVDEVQPTVMYTSVRDFVKNSAPRQRHGSPRIDFTGSGMSLTLSGPVWTLRWAAPELLEGATPHLASDIWALGWICWEASPDSPSIMTSQVPFSDVHEGDNQTVVLRVMAGDLPKTQDNTHLAQIEALRLMMLQCWAPSADQRPLAQDCLQTDRVVPSSSGMDGPSCIRSAALLRRYGRKRAMGGKVEEGFTYVHRALQISKSTSDVNGTADALCLLGDIYRNQAEYGKAEASYIESTDVRSRIGDPQYSGDAFQSLGDLYRAWGKNDEAEASYIQALEMYTQANSGPRVMAAFRSLENLYREGECDGRGRQGASDVNLGVVCRRLADPKYLPDSLRLLAKTYLVRGCSERAEVAYIELKESYARRGDSQAVADVLRVLGDVYRVHGKDDPAEDAYTQAKNIYTASKSQGYLGPEMGLLGVGLKLLGDLHCAKGNYSRASHPISSHGTFASPRSTGLALVPPSAP
ncbi:hypothetical protein FRC01_012328 [Tulasnella sp. 417]|nr:hypothetical protein FRC01_012328 [Tulasnella sp. 417]